MLSNHSSSSGFLGRQPLCLRMDGNSGLTSQPGKDCRRLICLKLSIAALLGSQDVSRTESWE